MLIIYFQQTQCQQCLQFLNLISMAMIIGQSIVWKDKVVEIMTGEKGKSNPMALGGFILAAILSGVCN